MPIAIGARLVVSHGAFDLRKTVTASLIEGPTANYRRLVEMVGFSGGVQRLLVAGQLLQPLGIQVNRLTGIAGPTLGPAPTPDAVVFLDDGWTTDPVVTSAGSLVFSPLSFALGGGDRRRGRRPASCPVFPQQPYARAESRLRCAVRGTVRGGGPVEVTRTSCCPTDDRVRVA